jgi:transposase
MRITQTYTDEFRADALQLVLKGNRSVMGVAADLGINHWTLREWIKNDRMRQKKKHAPKAPPGPKASGAIQSGTVTLETMTAEQKLVWLEQENARLQQQVKTLQMDREILKKAAAFFAKESARVAPS